MSFFSLAKIQLIESALRRNTSVREIRRGLAAELLLDGNGSHFLIRFSVDSVKPHSIPRPYYFFLDYICLIQTFVVQICIYIKVLLCNITFDLV